MERKDCNFIKAAGIWRSLGTDYSCISEWFANGDYKMSFLYNEQPVTVVRINVNDEIFGEFPEIVNKLQDYYTVFGTPITACEVIVSLIREKYAIKNKSVIAYN